MGAWIGAEAYWLQEANIGSHGLRMPFDNHCRLDTGRPSSVKEEEEEQSRRRMVELMLGPCKYLYHNTLQYGREEAGAGQQLPTLDLLNAAGSASSLAMDYSSASVTFSSMDSTPIELEPDSPLPSGWEKCLDLKTGSIYYLNRRAGLNSSVDPRKALLCDGKSGVRGADLNSQPTSPATSEVTMEASLKSNAKLVPLHILNEQVEGDGDILDLSLSLHVGQSSSHKRPPQINASEEARNVCSSSAHPASFKLPSSVQSASSSSSSTTSLPTNSSFLFPHTGISSKESRPDLVRTLNRQEASNQLWLAPPKESMCVSSADHPHSEITSSTDYTNQAAESGGGHGACNAPAMVTVACANCLMFVMLSRSNPRCPRCGTCPDHLDFPQPPLKRAKLGFSFR